MSNLTKIIGATALGLGIAVAIPVLGHGFGAGMPGMYGNGQTPGAGHHMGMHSGQMQPGQMLFGGNVEESLANLRQSLNLTTEQQPAWDQYEQAIKNLVASIPTEHPNWGNADEHYDQMEQHFTQMKAVFDAHKALYATLTDEQKQKVNETMPGPFGHHHGYNG